MKNRQSSIRSILLFIVFTFFLSVSLMAKASTFDNLIIFGDSLSDTGNLASVTANFPFPFYRNRISNGPVIVDFLAAELGLDSHASKHLSSNPSGHNFAIAGGNIIGEDTEDLSSQVSAFLQIHNGVANRSDLFFLMMGGNDLRDIRSIRSTVSASAQIDKAIDQLLLQLNRLYNADARAFLITNVANIGRIPETLSRSVDDTNIVSRAEGYVRLYNQRLSIALDVFSRKPGVSLVEFDLFAELELLAENAVTLGFTQTDEGCFTIDRFSFHPDCDFGAGFDRFIFFDSLHPTAKANAIVARSLINFIPSMPINTKLRQRGGFVIAPVLELLLGD